MKKTVLITGASNGIGRATAVLFAENGYNVVINYNKSKAEAELLQEELNSKGFSTVAIKADVSKSSEVQAMFEKAYELFGNVDVLVNNAGIAKQILFTDISEEEWDEIFAVNVKSMFLCSKAVLPKMIHNKSGAIVNISSIWGICGASCEVHYSATKGAIISFTKALASEVGPSGIRVNCVAPGVVATKMNNALSEETIEMLKEETPLGVIGTPEDIANSVLFLASDNARFITGQILSPNGGNVM